MDTDDNERADNSVVLDMNEALVADTGPLRMDVTCQTDGDIQILHAQTSGIEKDLLQPGAHYALEEWVQRRKGFTSIVSWLVVRLTAPLGKEVRLFDGIGGRSPGHPASRA